MSYVGKILVVVQVVLSLLFMAFAGAVFSMHANWQAKYQATQTQLESTQQNLETVQSQLDIAQRGFADKLAAETERANKFQAQAANLQAQVATSTTRNQQLEQQRETQTGLAEAKSAEAKFRQQESEKQRIENDKLQDKLNATAAQVRDLTDQVFSKDQMITELQKRYDAMLVQKNFLEKIVAAEGLETNPRIVAQMQSPPPPVEGLVMETRANRAGRVQYVDISIGSDDGLVANHELDVYRSAGKTSEWLGKIRIVDVLPDSAVGEVVLEAKNGIIAEGDNVTSKL